MLGYLLAVLAAGFNAVSNILQREANRQEPPEVAMRLRLILDLLHRPIWLAGVATVTASFVLDAAALSVGRLAGVQPVLVLELPLTLFGASVVLRGARLRTREWLAIAGMSAGVAGLIFFLDPTQGHQHGVRPLTWAVGVALTVGAVGACVSFSSRGGPSRRPALLGLASGVGFGLTAAFMKAATAALGQGPAAVFETWSTYAMVLSGLVAMFLMQNALQAGRLIAAQPGITLADPGVAILWGVLAFGERIRGGAYTAGAVLSGLALAAGVMVLSNSPLLHQDRPGGRRRDPSEKEPACEAR